MCHVEGDMTMLGCWLAEAMNNEMPQRLRRKRKRQPKEHVTVPKVPLPPKPRRRFLPLRDVTLQHAFWGQLAKTGNFNIGAVLVLRHVAARRNLHLLQSLSNVTSGEIRKKCLFVLHVPVWYRIISYRGSLSFVRRRVEARQGEAVSFLSCLMR